MPDWIHGLSPSRSRDHGREKKMLSEKLQEALNAQLQRELYSAYLYLAMAAQMEADGLPGFAHWMRVQAQEEVGHAMKFYDFINERRGRVVLQAIEQPPKDFGTPLAAFEQALAHEQMITARIHELYALAAQEQDYASQVFLHWFVEEQVEEELITSQVIDQLKRIGDDDVGLLILDKELGEREPEEE